MSEQETGNAVTAFARSDGQQLHKVAPKERVKREDCVTQHMTLVLKEYDLAGLHTSREQRSPLGTNWRDAIKF